MVMQTLSKAALLALGLSISGTAMADQYYGGPLLYPNTLTIRIIQPTAPTITQLMDGIRGRGTLGPARTGIRLPRRIRIRRQIPIGHRMPVGVDRTVDAKLRRLGYRRFRRAVVGSASTTRFAGEQKGMQSSPKG